MRELLGMPPLDEHEMYLNVLSTENIGYRTRNPFMRICK